MDQYLDILCNKATSRRYNGQLDEIRKYLDLYVRNKKSSVSDSRAAMICFGIVCTILSFSILWALGVIKF